MNLYKSGINLQLQRVSSQSLTVTITQSRLDSYIINKVKMFTSRKRNCCHGCRCVPKWVVHIAVIADNGKRSPKNINNKQAMDGKF